MKYLFVISCYNDYRQKIFDEIISPRNKEYCNLHGYKYVEIKKENNPIPFRGNLTWNKWSIINDLLIAGTLKDDDEIINIDSDQYIVNINANLKPVKTFSYVIDSCNSHCNSLLSFRINEWSRKLIKEILSEERWNRLKDIKTAHEGIDGKFDSFYREFREQAMMYALFGIKRHSNTSFWDLPNNGWHSQTTKDTIFSVDELREHVMIWPTAYNVTAFEGEHEGLFFMNKVEKEDVITRHFAGGQDWNNIKNWIK